MVFRPMSAPAPNVPLGVRSVGHYRIAREERERAFRKNFIQLFWSIRGTGSIRLKGRFIELKPGMIAFYFPGDLHDLGFLGPGKAWEYRWLTLDGPVALEVVKGFGFRNDRPYYGGPAPALLFDELAERLREVTVAGEIRAGATAFAILSTAAKEAGLWREGKRFQKTRMPNPHRADAMDDFRKRANACIYENWRDSGFGIDQLAEQLGMNRSSFSRKFHALFGVPPLQYILRIRVQQALGLLKHSGLPVAQIARCCGWEDANYFSRCIRDAVGMSPSEFRASSSGTDFNSGR